MILEAVYALFVAVTIYFLVEYIIHLSHLSKFPAGPFPFPLIGNLHQLGRKPHEELKKLSKKYGDVFSISIGSQRIVVVNGIEPAREALLRTGEDLSGRPQNMPTAAIISRNYQDIGFADHGPALKLMRKIAHSALKFYGNGLENLESSIVVEIDELFKRYDDKTEVPTDPYNDMALAVINIICSIIFGNRYRIDDPEFLDIVRHGKLITQGMDNASAVAFIPWLRFFPNEGISKLKEGVAIRDAILSRKLREHRETLDPNNLRDFTDALINELSKETDADSKVQKLLTDMNMEMILADLFVAGAETTTTTLHWSIAYLVTWPEVQQKIAEERKRVIGDRQPCLKDRGNLPYFEATIQEVMRLSSLVPLGVPHKTTCDTTFGGQRVPKGTQVWFNQWALHYDEREWTNPELFKPERWLEADGNLVHGKNKSFLPFGAGRRVCIGEALAKVELFLFLANILYRYEIKQAPEGSPNLEGMLAITYSPKPYRVILKKR